MENDQIHDRAPHYAPTVTSESIFKRRVRKFKKMKRAYFSLIALSLLYFLSFFNPIFINGKALIVKYNDAYYFPAVGDTNGRDVFARAMP